MKVFATSQLPGEALLRLEQHCDLSVWEEARPVPADVLGEKLASCQGLLCLLTNRVDAALLSRCPDLAFVSSMSVGVDHVDVAALSRRHIPLGFTPGVLVDTTADLTLALLLAAARRIPEADRFVREGRWNPAEPWHPDMFVGKDLAGATLGILGLGAIGQAVAQRAAAFGMRLVGWNRTPRELPGVELLAFEDVLAQADFLSIHVALTDDTRMLVDRAAIEAMKPGAVLVNTARGGIVDEQALADALTSGHLFSAGVDVFAREPVATDNPLLSLTNVVVAPHIGSATRHTRQRMADLAVDNLLDALQGQPMRYCFNPEVYGDFPGG